MKQSIFCLVTLCCILISGMGGIFAQLSVVSTVPSNGTASVDTAGVLAITFDQPIDTTARFLFPPNLFLSLAFSPDSLVNPPDSITMSADLKTAYFHNLHLSPNTFYWFLIADAVALSGDSLSQPYFFVFTTDNTLPTASVSGTVSYPGNDPGGTLAALVDGNPFGENESFIKNAVITQGPSGSYWIDFVEPGQYWMAAAKDFFIDASGDIELKPGTALGYLDADGDLVPDSFMVSQGVPLSGMDMTIQKTFLQTARDGFPTVNALAQNWSIDARLTGILGEVLPEGTALGWKYIYYSPGLADHKAWLNLGDFLVVTDSEAGPADTLAVPQNWLNSDSVLAIAENNGGSDFRQQYRDAIITASLGKSTLNFGDKRAVVLPALLPAIEINFTDIAVWMVQYYSDSADVGFPVIIDAETGVILSGPATAATAEQAAQPVAVNWAPDAKLWAVGTFWFSSIDSVGRSQWWNCFYYSPSLDSLRFVGVWGSFPVLFADPGWPPPDTSTVASGWINSDAAIAYAESAGGAIYRQQNDSVFVQANLTRWWNGPNPALTIWQFDYTSVTAPPETYIIDAINGGIVSLKDGKDGHLLPTRLKLHQNFPNPFNPVTHLKYEVPEAGNVELILYNSLGQQSAVLFNKFHQPGQFEFDWRPGNLASGTYFLLLKSGKEKAVRKIMYLK